MGVGTGGEASRNADGRYVDVEMPVSIMERMNDELELGSTKDLAPEDPPGLSVRPAPGSAGVIGRTQMGAQVRRRALKL